MVLDKFSSVIHDCGMNFFKELLSGFMPLDDHLGYENLLNDKRKMVGELPRTSPV
jgi:hypothetical protein